jgi:hypothetical protein
MPELRRSAFVMAVPFVVACATRRPDVGNDAPRNFLIETRYGAPHGVVFAAAARALVDEGYTVRLRDSTETTGQLVSHPRHTWIPCLEAEEQAKVGHPGIVAMIVTERVGDSTVFRVTAQTLAPTPVARGLNDERVDLGLPLQLCSMTGLASRVDSILGTAKPSRPGTADAPVMPRTLGDFVLVDTQRFSVPGAGTGYRYAGPKGLKPDVYVYPGDLEAFGTDTAAALRAAVDEFLQILPTARARGQFTDFEVRSNTAARRDIAGRPLLVHRVVVEKRVGERVLDDYFHIAVLRDNYVKVRTTFERGLATEEDVEHFVRQMLASLRSP